MPARRLSVILQAMIAGLANLASVSWSVRTIPREIPGDLLDTQEKATCSS